jgi:hypothetical protein
MTDMRTPRLRFLVVLLFFSEACAWHVATEEEARQAAIAKIKKSESSLGYDAKTLKVLSMTRVDDGWDFEVRDEAQNVWVFVHVSPTGLAEISAEPLDAERRRHEEAIREARMRKRNAK